MAAAEELKVVLRRNEHSGFGFSLLGTTGPPHVIYEIHENSPAADSAVEAGDIILKVNGTDVHRYTTKEVLKCLRLSDDSVTLELRRDAKLKARLKEQLANTKNPHYEDIEPSPHIYDYKAASCRSPTSHHRSLSLQDSYEPPHNSNSNSSSSPAIRYAKSPTHLPHRQGSLPTPATASQQQQGNHSRSSSASSAQLQFGDTNASVAAGGGGAGGATCTSPTSRPSRIPTALKAPQKPTVQHSPQHKRPRPSQIPTKAGPAGAVAATNGNAPPSGNATQSAVPATVESGSAHLQHSNSYSGSSQRFTQQQQQQERDGEPNSAPPQPAKAPRFEAYMMTGELILNLSRTSQSSNLLPGHAKKIDSLRDSPQRAVVAARANGALAPRASGESSPTSSSSVDSPTHTGSSVSAAHHHKDRGKRRHQQPHHHLLQQQLDSINNSYNNSNSGGGGAGGMGATADDARKDDTLLLCEELERDDEELGGGGGGADNNRRQRYHQHQAHSSRRHQYSNQQQRSSYEHDECADIEENEEDQTHYDITNIETYNSGGIGAGDVCGDDDASDRQCLVTHYGDDEDDDGDEGEGEDFDAEDEDGCGAEHEDEDYSSNSLTSASAKQRLRALKQKAAAAHYKHAQSVVRASGGGGGAYDSVDCARQHYTGGYHQQHHHYHHNQQQHPHQHRNQQHRQQQRGSGGSTSSSATVKSDGMAGINTSPDETSFSVPTSPISLSTPLIDKDTANSVPTSPEPSSLGAVGGGGVAGHDGVVRRHNGVVRTCDSAGFRTSKSEDHLQQVQREGMAAVIPIDIDEDVNSSLNTLLDTRQDSEDSQGSNRDRIVWTYNAPLAPHQIQQLQQQQQMQQHLQQQYSSTHYGAGGGGGGVGGHNNSSPNSQSHSQSHSHSHSHSHSSSISSSPQHSAGSPASPTSVSSSVMSSSGSKGALGIGGAYALSSNNNGGHHQQQQQQQQQQLQLTANAANGGTSGGTSATTATTALQMGGMVLSDPSDSDSTILVSDTAAARKKQQQHQQLQQQAQALHQQQLQQQQQQQQQQKTAGGQQQNSEQHKLVIQVRGIDTSNSASTRSAYSELKDSEDELATLTDEPLNTVLTVAGCGDGFGGAGTGRDSSPPVSDDGSDVESLHSYHYSPKAVDMPSAIRLAKRLYSLDGFKKSDVSRHLSKNNDFSRAVADEYLKYFNFEKKTLDQSLREFLQQFSLSGETQERERVLVHFSKRFLDCNPGTFNSQDAVHTLTCAIMLLNTDLHGQNIGRKMTCAEFIENLTELNDGENFPKDVLKYLYQAIKTQPLEWALDDDSAELQKQRADNNVGNSTSNSLIGQNPFLDIPESSSAIEYKKGYVMRKCCFDSNYKKTPFGKRSWKMFYCTLRDLVLFLHKDEHGFRKSQMSDNLHNAIRIHHALATKATDYIKKQHVFRLQTADQAEYLFQTSDSKELQSWVETINFVCAAYSAPPLEGGVGSQKRFQRPLLPSTHTKYLMKEQLESHEQQLSQLEAALADHKKGPIPNKGLPLQNYKEKENYLQYEIRRYRAYVSILTAKLLADQQQLEAAQQQQQLTSNEELDTFSTSGGGVVGGAVIGARQQQPPPAYPQQLQLQQPTAQSPTAQQQQQAQPQQQQTANRKKEKKK